MFNAPHIYTIVDLYVCMCYSSACGAQLIRFSYVTNMSRPQESGYVQATYKNESTYKKYHLTPQLEVHKCVWLNGELVPTQDS